MSLLTLDQVTNQPLASTDAGIVLKEDGTFRVFNLHKDIDPNNITEAQGAQMRKIMALTFVLQTPELLDQLYDAAAQVAAVTGTVDFGQLS